MLGLIEELKARLRHQLHEPRRWAGSLRRVSLARAIQGSNSIEGYEAGLDDAVDVAAGEEPLDADEETSLALRGYRDVMTYVLQMAEDEGGYCYSSQLLKSLIGLRVRNAAYRSYFEHGPDEITEATENSSFPRGASGTTRTRFLLCDNCGSLT
ncbi:MAG: hypothetical protein ACRDRI_10910 [Pseudonocardiaceae bacterium]